MLRIHTQAQDTAGVRTWSYMNALLEAPRVLASIAHPGSRAHFETPDAECLLQATCITQQETVWKVAVDEG